MKKIAALFFILCLELHGISCKDIPNRVATDNAPTTRIGMAQLSRYVRIGRNSPENIRGAEKTFEKLDKSKIDSLIRLGNAKLRDKTELPKVANNLEHVDNQHLKPLEADAKQLEKAFGIDGKKLELLMVAHDLGKVEIPPDMLKALTALFPGDFVAREILSHEYASMYWIENLGKESGLSEKEIHALQTLISNHNFGPDLTRAGNEELSSHWWPAMFKNKFIPQLEKAGIEMKNYGSAEEGVYSSLLSAYDRAIANEFNRFGLSTWQKFAEQDYNAWQGNSVKDPTLKSPFDGPSLVNRMKMSAQWAESEIDSLWGTLKTRYAKQPGFDLKSFEPYRKQKEGIEKLRTAIAQMEKENPVTVPGSVNFRSADGTLYRVDDKSASHSSARVFKWTGSEWTEIQEGASPVKLLFGLK